MAGLPHTIAALVSLRKKNRAPGWGLALAMVLVPLAVLTLVPKKNVHYIWYAAPAIGLLAAGVLRTFPRAVAMAACALFLFLAALQTTKGSGTLENRIDPAAFYGGNTYPIVATNRFSAKSPEPLARRLAEALSACGEVEGRPLIVYGPRATVVRDLLFALMWIEPRPVYWHLDMTPPAVPPHAMALELREDPTGGASVSHQFQASVERIHQLLPLAMETDDARVYCRGRP